MKLDLHPEGSLERILAEFHDAGAEGAVELGEFLNMSQVEELFLQLIEHELGSMDVYATALHYARSVSLREEWELAIEDTRAHLDVLVAFCEALGLNPSKETPGRVIARHLGVALVEAMNMAVTARNPATAELVACECVLLSETKAQFGWELLRLCSEGLEALQVDALRRAYRAIADAAKLKFFRARGWCHRLWIESLAASSLTSAGASSV